ncbi:retrovirus-related pol polyprotein from transposon TNT 1-94 [Tanacetum coccineum]
MVRMCKDGYTESTSFFEMNQVDDDGQKIRLVSMHVFDKALNWHKQFMKNFGEIVTWEVYDTQVRKRFESVFKDPVVELKNLKHTTNVQIYQDSFEALLNKVKLSESYAVSLFNGGLKEEIAYDVRMFKPTTLIDIFYFNALQTQTSNALHNAIMESGGKDRPPILAPGNYVQWKSRLKRCIDTKPNKELLHHYLTNPPYKYKWIPTTTTVAEDSMETITPGHIEAYHNVPKEIREQLDTEDETILIILIWIDNEIYSTIDACPNACEMWKTIERLKQDESINVQDIKTNLYWEFGKFTLQDDESLESYYSRFYKMMNELVRNKCEISNHQVNVQFLLQLQPEWQIFMTLVKQNQELRTVSYHKLYDILKQHQNEVYEIRVERQVRTANLLALVSQQQPVYHPQSNPNHCTQNSSSRSQPATTKNRGKAIAYSPPPTYDQESAMDANDDEMSKEKEIDKLMALISISFKKIYKTTNNNLKTSSNTSRANQDNSLRLTKELARECQKPKRVRDSAYHKEKMLLYKQEEAGIQLSAEQVDWRDDTDDELENQELEAHYMYMAKIQEVSPDDAESSGHIFISEPLLKVQYDDDHYSVFTNDRQHPKQPEFINDTYLEEQINNHVILDSFDMGTNGGTADQDDDDLANECELLASLIDKLKCEIDDS